VGQFAKPLTTKATKAHEGNAWDWKRNRAAAWFYPDPKAAAIHFKGYVAFWKGVKVEK